MLTNFLFVLLCFYSCNCQNSYGNFGNQRFQTITSTKAPVAQKTDINASDNDFPKVPEILNKPIQSGNFANINRQQSNIQPTKAPESSLISGNIFQPLGSYFTTIKAPVNTNQKNEQYTPTESTVDPQQIFNKGSNNQHTGTLFQPTSASIQKHVHNTPKTTLVPQQTFNTESNNQQKQQNDIYQTVTTSDPKIFFPEEDRNLNRKPVSHVCIIICH